MYKCCLESWQLTVTEKDFFESVSSWSMLAWVFLQKIPLAQVDPVEKTAGLIEFIQKFKHFQHFFYNNIIIEVFTQICTKL